jgi:DNA-binding MarR family transcriptional regulator
MTAEQRVRFRQAYLQVLRDLDTVRLRQWEQHKVTLPQLRVLYQVRRTPGITTCEMSRLLGVTVSTTSGLVIKLVDRGLLARTVLPDDRRQVPLCLTPEGEALVGEMAETGRSFLDRVAAHLGDDVESVTAALERLVAAAADVRAPAEPDAASTSGRAAR